MPKLQPQPGKRNLNLRGDTKTVYEQLASLFGVKAAFDPDITPKSVHLQVDGVDFSIAMALLGSQSATFWLPLNPTLMFVAPDTPEKRRQYAQEAEQTFLLSAAVGPEDVTEMLRVLRDITGGTRIDMDTRSRTITMRDTPERLALGRRADRTARKGARRSHAGNRAPRSRPQQSARSWHYAARLRAAHRSEHQRHQYAQSVTTLTNLLTNSTSLRRARVLRHPRRYTHWRRPFHLSLLTLPGATANFSDTLSLVQSGRQVLLRAQDGKPASFFVGDRFPITLSLLSGSLGNGAAAAGLPAPRFSRRPASLSARILPPGGQQLYRRQSSRSGGRFRQPLRPCQSRCQHHLLSCRIRTMEISLSLRHRRSPWVPTKPAK